MLRVATVLSAREWEARLVAAARETAMVKLVLRAFVPDEVSNQADSIDVVVAGSETPWVTPTRVASWRRLGLRVVGLHPASDRPAAERLAAGGADLVLCDDLEADLVIREIRLLDAAPIESHQGSGRLIVVTGVHGGSGVTEVALALAWNESGRARTVLVDGNLIAPSIAVRLGLPPRPDLTDVVDEALGSGVPSVEGMPTTGRLVVIPGSMRDGDTGLRPEAVVDVATALAIDSTVVLDAGAWPSSGSMVSEADQAVVVAGGTPTAIVRLARLAEGWIGPRPHLILNEVHGARRLEVVAAVRRWSGLEPAAIVPPSRRLHAAAVSGAEPPSMLRRRLITVGRGDGE